jgi:hypothetical protein
MVTECWSAVGPLRRARSCVTMWTDAVHRSPTAVQVQPSIMSSAGRLEYARAVAKCEVEGQVGKEAQLPERQNRVSGLHQHESLISGDQR